MKKNKKLLKIFIIFIFIIFIFTSSFADDIPLQEEDFDIASYLRSSDYLETSSPTQQFPSINSRAYVVLDRKTNTVLVGKNEYSRKKMASTTKIMTAIVIIENYNLNETVTISKKASNTGGSRLGLKTGDKITVNDLLYGLMLRSGNDAAVALAEYASGSIENFAELMNKKALELNLPNTNFVTPHGLDQDEHYTTAYELALLTNYALNNKTFAKIVGSKTFAITINGYSKELSNTNELLGNFDGIYGVKTGFTNGANRCLVTACKRDDKDIICVVLGADTKKFRTQDSIKLLNYALNNFTYVAINKIIEDKFNRWIENNNEYFNVYKGINNNLSLSCPKLQYDKIPVKIDQIDKINISINCNGKLIAPIYKNYVVGTLTVLVDDKILYSLDICSECCINKKDMIDYLKTFFKNFSTYINLENLFFK